MIKTYIIAACLAATNMLQAQTFQLSPQNFQGVFYGDCTVGDLNGDNKLDFMVSGAMPGYIGYSGVFSNNNGQLTPIDIPQLSQVIYSATAIEDLNGDNRKDIIITGTKTSSSPQETIFEIHTNNGDGTFTKSIPAGIIGVNNGSLQIADFNDDGKKDIFVNGNADVPSSKIYFQQTDGTFQDANAGLTGTTYSATKVFDANADGSPDILITGFNIDDIPVTKLYINSGLGGFTELEVTIPNVYFSSVDTADIDNDGDIDLLVSGLSVPSGGAAYNLGIYLNDGAGNFSEMPTDFLGTAIGTSKFVDYNNDGFTDVFSTGVTLTDGTKAQLYKNNGDQTFTLDTENSVIITALNASKAAWFDIDNDGDKDLLTMGFDGENPHTQLYINNTISTENCSEPGLNTGDLGCVTFIYNGIPTTYATVRGSDGNIWLRQNLGSDNVALSVADINSYGDSFQWGRWDDGHQKRNSETAASPTSNNPLGLNGGSASYLTGSPAWWSTNALTDTWEAATPAEVTDTNSCDPCKAIGQGWKLPTQAEWAEIISLEAIESPATAYASTLKLPGNGYRSATNGNFTFVGTRGYYWSSTASSSGAKYLYIGTASANAAAGASRGQGAAIRCLKLKENLGTGGFDQNKFSLYPNPASDIFNIKTDLRIENISVYNQIGQLVVIQKASQVNLSGAASGIYIVHIKFDNGQTAVQKVIKK